MKIKGSLGRQLYLGCVQYVVSNTSYDILQECLSICTDSRWQWRCCCSDIYKISKFRSSFWFRPVNPVVWIDFMFSSFPHKSHCAILCCPFSCPLFSSINRAYKIYTGTAHVNPLNILSSYWTICWNDSREEKDVTKSSALERQCSYYTIQDAAW